jgi:hypothetical protein
MKRHKVISPKNLPVQLPIKSTIVLWLLLDRLKVPQWVWGCMGALTVILWAALIVILVAQQDTDIFSDKKEL